MSSIFQGKSFLATADYTKEELLYLIGFSEHLKELKNKNVSHRYLENKNIVLLFEKTSTRTRSAFTVAANDLGANVEFMGKDDIQLGKKESVYDTARVLGRMFDAIEFRGFKQAHVEELAEHAGVPVWNGLTDTEHPTQMIADFMTIKEHFGKLEGLTLAYYGVGKNNMNNSLMVTSAILGVNYTLACPEGEEPEQEVVDTAQKFAKETGAKIIVTNDPIEAVKDADIVYTNVWAAMGQEHKFGERVKMLQPFQVNKELLSHNKKDDLIFLHCLPAFHNTETTIGQDMYEKFDVAEMEVTDEVFLSPIAKQFDQSENRMHTIKAIMAATLGNLYIPKV